MNRHEQPAGIAVSMEKVSYDRKAAELPVLSEISLAIPEGQWVGIAGRNGAGKSTLVRLLNGLLPASGGRIAIGGLPLGADTLWEIRKRVGIVFSNPDNQFVGLTVADDIAFGLESLRLDAAEIEARILRYAELLGITSLLNHHPSFLSGGQKQRAAIAAVLAMEPRIVIFDEAASMLDERSRRDILDMMRRMRAEGRYTLISVTHDTEELAAADRMLVLDGGRIAADGRPAELMKSDELLNRCGMQAPYALQVSRELARQGIGIGEHLTEKELLDALWAYDSSMLRTVTKTGA